MRNEYGVVLDRNGYAPSVISEEEACYLCGKEGDLVRHEIFFGPNRKKSKALGCWVKLCPGCHRRLHTRDPEIDWKLHRIGQRKAMNHYNWSIKQFRERFGKSWI